MRDLEKKVRRREKGSRPSSPRFLPVLFSCSPAALFQQFADSTMTEPGTGYRNRGWISESMLKINTLVTEFGIIQNRFLAGLKGFEVRHNVSELLVLVNIT